MSIVAEYLVDRPRYAVVMDDFPEMRLLVEGITACDPETVLITFWAEGTDFDEFETGLGRTDAITGVETLSDGESGRKLFQIRLPAAEVGYWAWAERGGVLLACTLDHDGMTMRMRFPDRKSLVAYRKHCEEAGCSFDLIELKSTNAQPKKTQDGLTAAQRTLLTAAVEEGYFEIPRGVTIAELAAQFDISDQAASERLRRGLSNTLANGTHATHDRPEIPVAE